jgi:hypothetical protein
MGTKTGNKSVRRTLPSWLRLAASGLVAAVFLAAGAASALADDRNDNRGSTDRFKREFNRRGNILIADQFNNRVIEIDRRGNIVWQFGQGPTDFTALSIVGVNDAQRVGDLTLMAGTGTPPNTVPECTDPAGCPDNRVMLVDREGQIVWQYGTFAVTGSGPDQLNTPTQATFLPDGDVLITDQANQRVIEVNRERHIAWQYGTTGVSGVGPNQLNSPNSAELLENGRILIADEANNRAIEVDHALNVLATFSAGGTVNGMAFASRLPNGHTLLTDAGNNRIVEVDASDAPVWEYFTNTQTGSNPAPSPTRAIRLRNGDTIISDQFNHRVIVVDPSKSIVVSYGNLNVSGYGTSNTSQGLFGPYDAKVIGDYTGLTPPFDFDDRR